MKIEIEGTVPKPGGRKTPCRYEDGLVEDLVIDIRGDDNPNGNHGIDVTINGWDYNNHLEKEERHPTLSQLFGKKVRVTIEVVEDSDDDNQD